MKFIRCFVGFLSIWCTSATARMWTPDTEDVASKRNVELQTQYQQNVLGRIENRATGCRSQNLRHRKEWSNLAADERAAFIDAIHCLNALPAETHAKTGCAPGARTRYDDFVVTHIEQTPRVHASGLFLPFHRHFLALFESDLRSRCGYAGPMPYWDWTATYRNLTGAPIFDGGDLSMGGNGEFVPGRNATSIVLPGGVVKKITPGTGGGCVKKGPFREGLYEVRLGPVGFEPKGPQGGLGYNPRCLTRDLNPEYARGTRPSALLAAVEGCGGQLGCVNEELDNADGVPGGLHASGHWQVGLDALDVFASPSDPIFWLHHAQVDRVWTIWQGLDPDARTYQVWGTETAGNVPPSNNVTLDTEMDFAVLDRRRTIREVSSTVDGDYCYMYE